AGALFQFIPDVEVHSFMSSVILRFSGTATLQINAESKPPGREPTEAHYRAAGGEWRAVVATYRFGKTMLMKELLEDSTYRFRLCGGHTANFQNVAAFFIPHGQRFAAHAVEGMPPAFEIDRPDVVHFFGLFPEMDSPGLGILPAF